MLNESTPAIMDGVAIRIETRSGDEIVFLDKQDLEKASSIVDKWRLFKDARGVKFARSGKDSGQKMLHKLLFVIPKGYKMVWINGNTLDLRRRNLQLVDKEGNVTLLEDPKPSKVYVKGPMDELREVPYAKEDPEPPAVHLFTPVAEFLDIDNAVVEAREAAALDKASIEVALKPDPEPPAVEREAIRQSGVPGIKWHRASNMWTARLYHEKVRYSLGYFKELQKAIEEVAKFRVMGPHSPHLLRNQREGKK